MHEPKFLLGPGHSGHEQNAAKSHSFCRFHKGGLYRLAETQALIEKIKSSRPSRWDYVYEFSLRNIFTYRVGYTYYVRIGNPHSSLAASRCRCRAPLVLAPNSPTSKPCSCYHALP